MRNIWEYQALGAEVQLAASLTAGDRHEYHAGLRILSLPARELLALILRRGRRTWDGCAVLLQEIEDTTGMSPHEVAARVGQLSGRGLAVIEAEQPSFEGFTGPYVAATDNGEYPTWDQLKSYCDANSIAIAKLVAELRFDLLDELPDIA